MSGNRESPPQPQLYVMLDGIHTREVGSEFHPADCDCGGCEALDGVCEGCGYALEDDGSCLRCAGRKKA